MKDIRREDIQKAFERMLSRVGGGFTFSSWLSVSHSQRGVDFSLALYGSDYKNQSHIVGYVGVIKIDETIRIKAEISYYEHIKDVDFAKYIEKERGKLMSSDSSEFLPSKDYHYLGKGYLSLCT